MVEEEEEEEGVWVRSGGGGRGKEPELPDLNKVNFPAIWSVFRMEGKASKAAAAAMRRLRFRLPCMQNLFFFFSVTEPTQRLFKGLELKTLGML